MDEKSLQVLEFTKVKEILADYTSFPVSREVAIALMPSSDAETVSFLLKQSAEARRLLSLNPNFSIGGIKDIREDLAMAARGKTLLPQSLVDIQITLASASKLRASLEELATEAPSLWDAAIQIVVMPQLEKEIGRCIDDAGEILDSASTELVWLRHRLRETRQRLLHRLEGIIKSTTGQTVLQEPLITEREGRYVVPVKTELQREMKGIVHDVSNTGATLFVEPFAVVEMGNKLRQLVLEEEREVQRILTHLSAEVGATSDVILGNLDLISKLDLALAKARYAEKVNAAEPQITTFDEQDDANSKALRLVSARHPLLKEKAVPLSVEIGSEFPGLVITGPNTGGKTVALKTIGLLSLMAQSGMPIPASEESCIPIFDNVFADIGDEQSIEQTLSTFSWHMGNIVRIIQASTKRSLVLLDELGTSTDPSEGASLARAILLHFLSKRAFVVATTHYGELKFFAHTTLGLRNASLEFDPVTLRPTYHLMMGIPGGSNALAIASQLGLPDDIIITAREMISKGTTDFEEILKDLIAEKRATRELRYCLDKERTDVSSLRSSLENELQGLRAQEKGMLREARDRVNRDVAELQKQIKKASSELKKARSKEDINQAQKKLDATRKQMQGATWRIDVDHDGLNLDIDSITVGDQVKLLDANLTGTVLSMPQKGSQIEIQAGQTKIRVDLANVERVTMPEGKPVSESYVLKRSPTGRKRLLELDLRGKRAEEAEPELDSYLNDALLSGLGEVRIVHGYGTGTIRQIVRDMLGYHPLVKSFRSGGRGEGGDGVTVVKL